MQNTIYNIENISKIVNGKILTSENNTNISNIIIDSRKINDPINSIFIAIVGNINNGHNYINDAYKQGVRSFLVSENIDTNSFNNCNFILVNDTLKAFQDLVAYHRKQFNIPIVAITGSNGKTIVKEWLFEVLKNKYNIVKSPKSYNSQVGVPLSVWQINNYNTLGIFEAGISQKDEMVNLEKIISPEIGIITNIGEAHDEFFSSKEEKINEKIKLFDNAKTLIYCEDYILLNKIISSKKRNYNCFKWSKINSNSDLFIKSISSTNLKNTFITVVYKNIESLYSIPFIDKASIENAINCIAFLIYLNYSSEDIKEAIKNLPHIAMRLELLSGMNNCTIINDSYSSDIASLKIALDFVNQQTQHKKKTIVLSDILQTGKSSSELYKEVSELLKEYKIHRIIGIGEEISKVSDLFSIEKTFYNNTKDFLKDYRNILFRNEVVLFKGARKFEFEKIILLTQEKRHDTVFEVNLNAISHNLNVFKSILKPKTKIMVMVKAFSYGSGGFEIANLLNFNGVDYLGVAFADEGMELRLAGIETPIMIMNPDETSINLLIKHKLEPEIYSFNLLNLFIEKLKEIKLKEPFPIHIKLDTGMHRLGFEKKDLVSLIDIINENKDIVLIKSVFSHLVGSDDSMHDDFTLHQVNDFKKATDIIEQKIGYSFIKHILNSNGVARFPDYQLDMVRIGIGLYGVVSDENINKKLVNTSRLKSVISQIKVIDDNETIGYNRSGKADKKTVIATIPIGYADGLNRKLSNGKGIMFVNGSPAPIIGNVCMDMCMINITNIPNVKEGDEVIIFDENYTVTDLANNLETIPYEILTSISRRVKRIYFHE